jgi:hypothetical protein
MVISKQKHLPINCIIPTKIPTAPPITKNINVVHFLPILKNIS